MSEAKTSQLKPSGNSVVDLGQADNQHKLIVPKNTTAHLAEITNQEASLAYDTDLQELVLNDGTGFSPVGGGGGGGADVFLSNLQAPTAIPVDLLPLGSLNLGGPANSAWSGIYLNGIIKDKAGVNAIQVHTGFPGGNLRKLFDHTGQITMNFDSGKALYDAAGQQSILFGTRNLQDNTQQISLDWQNRITEDSSGFVGVDWENRLLNDTSNINQLTWGSGLRLGAAQLIWPATDGTVGQVLTTDGATNLSWADSGGGGGANTALSNLAAVAINASLEPASNQSINVGSADNAFGRVFTSRLTLFPEEDNSKKVELFTAIVPSSDYQIYLPPAQATASGQTLINNGAGQTSWGLPTSWTKYTVTNTDLSAASLTNDIELFSLPAKSVISGVVISQSASFTGTGITAYTVSVGVSGNLAKYASAFDVFQAPGDQVEQTSMVMDMENKNAASSIRIAATSVGANLDQASTGSVDIWVKWETLP